MHPQHRQGFFSSVSSESQEFLKYGWSLLTAFRGRGPRVLIDLHDDVGRYSKQQLAAMGVQPDRFETLARISMTRSATGNHASPSKINFRSLDKRNCK